MPHLMFQGIRIELDGLSWKAPTPIAETAAVNRAVWLYWTAGLRFSLWVCRHTDRSVSDAARAAREHVRGLVDQGVLCQSHQRRAFDLIANAVANNVLARIGK